MGRNACGRLIRRSDSGELVIHTSSASSHSNQPARPCITPSRSMRSSAVQEKKSGLSAYKSMSPNTAGAPNKASRGNSTACLALTAY